MSLFEGTNRLLMAQAIGAARAGEREEALRWFERLLARHPTTEQKVQIYFWMARLHDDPREKRHFLEQTLALDPWHPEARRKLALLDGHLQPEELIDPNRLDDEPAEESPETGEARRFVCLQCGGRLRFLPGGRALRCDYCARQVSLSQALDEGALLQEHDFVVALATAKGHRAATRMRIFICHACGARYLDETLSQAFTCPYCDAVYVANTDVTEETIPPEGVIPLSVPAAEAQAAMRAWLRRMRVRRLLQIEPPQGIYLPVWTFDIGGALTYSYRIVRHERERAWGGGTDIVRGEAPLLVNDFPVLASRSLPAEVRDLVHSFDFEAARPFDPAFLAGWPAEVYALSPADASLVARAAIFAREREEVERQARARLPFGAQMQDLNIGSSRMAVATFKLVLAPFWIARYYVKGEERPFVLVVDGQRRQTMGQRPPRRGLLAWLGF